MRISLRSSNDPLVYLRLASGRFRRYCTIQRGVPERVLLPETVGKRVG